LNEEKNIHEIKKRTDTDDRITFTFKPSQFYLILVLVALAAGLGIGYSVWERDAGLSQVRTEPEDQMVQQQVQVSTNIPRYDVQVDDDPALGDANAPVTIIEFSDYECPYCSRFHQETFGRLMDTYGDQIQFIYRDFPLISIHPEAFPAAEAANCAGEQGMYWEYHDKLFTGGSQSLGREAYDRYAKEIGLDIKAFAECFASNKYQAEVQADYDYALNLGVRSTPTFFINGIAVVGAQPYEVFQQIIEAELE
jgi:protein-disulfide isomerase